MIHRLVSLSSIASLALIVLMIVPVSAAPSLGIGSNANYNLSATLNAAQSCKASPITYNQTACGPVLPSYNVYILETNTTCSTSFSCYFSPENITVLPNTPVVWSNFGQSSHSVASCDSTNSVTVQACPVMDIIGLESFNSGVLSPSGTFSHSFSALGRYFYFDPIHPWMHGVLQVSPFAAPPSQASTPVQMSPFPITVAGNLGWNVVGLDRNTGVLNVSHALGLMVDSIPIAPVSESGSFQQSIDLSTRVESPGTATQLVRALALPSLALFAGTSVTGGFTNPIFSSSFGSSSNMPTMFTTWWVNGPLSKGSPVQIMMGFSSVQGDETVNLPRSLGSRSAWIVSSTFQESVNTVVPQSGSSGPVSNSDANVQIVFRFDYDKASDLLLVSADKAMVTTTATTIYQKGQTLCGAGGCTNVGALATVTHVMTVSVTASLSLSSTNLSLNKRMSLSGQATPSMFSILQDPSSIPVLYTLAGLVAAAIAGVAVLYTKRKNRHAPAPPAPLQSAIPTAQ